jgi:hypothetical protein
MEQVYNPGRLNLALGGMAKRIALRTAGINPAARLVSV